MTRRISITVDDDGGGVKVETFGGFDPLQFNGSLGGGKDSNNGTDTPTKDIGRNDDRNRYSKINGIK